MLPRAGSATAVVDAAAAVKNERRFMVIGDEMSDGESTKREGRIHRPCPAARL